MRVVRHPMSRTVPSSPLDSLMKSPTPIGLLDQNVHARKKIRQRILQGQRYSQAANAQGGQDRRDGHVEQPEQHQESNAKDKNIRQGPRKACHSERHAIPLAVDRDHADKDRGHHQRDADNEEGSDTLDWPNRHSLADGVRILDCDRERGRDTPKHRRKPDRVQENIGECQPVRDLAVAESSERCFARGDK